MGRAKPTDDIQTLLQEKERIEAWLQRLALATDETPAHVRAKVEQDYRGRLTDVMAELRGHRDELESAHERFSQERARLTSEETTASERLAEAELRHAVGEYDEKTWNSLKSEILESLVKIRESLQGIDAELSGLDGVLVLLREPVEGSHQTPEPVSRTQPTQPTAPPPQDPGQPVPQTDPLDEANMLTLETEDSQVPLVSEARGQYQERSDGSAPERGRLPEQDAEPAAKGEQVSLGIAGSTVPDQPSDIEGSSSASAIAGAKTLVCDECGTPNLPTEWYCERCGAELEAV